VFFFYDGENIYFDEYDRLNYCSNNFNFSILPMWHHIWREDRKKTFKRIQYLPNIIKLVQKNYHFPEFPLHFIILFRKKFIKNSKKNAKTCGGWKNIG